MILNDQVAMVTGAGQGIGAIHEVQAVSAYVAQLDREYRATRERLA